MKKSILLNSKELNVTIQRLACQLIENHGEFLNTDLEELESVDEIGEKIAASVVEFFNDHENIEIINSLKSYGLQFEMVERENNLLSEKLADKSIVVSGVFEKYSRDEIKKLIELNGGKVSSSISKNTSFILAGENMGPSKKQKAEELEVKIISEEDFVKIIYS